MTSMLVWIFLAVTAKVQGGKSIWNSNGSILINQRTEINTIDSSSRIIFDVTNEYLVDNLKAEENATQYTSYFSNKTEIPDKTDLELKVTVSPPIRAAGIQNSSIPAIFANLSDAYATVFHSKHSYFFYMVYHNSSKFLKEYFVAEARKTAQPHVSLAGWTKGMPAETACPSSQPLIHIMESTQAEVILICAQTLPNSGTQIKLAFYECSSSPCMTQMFSSTIDTPKFRQEISVAPSVGIQTLRAIRLEMNSTILNDTVFWSDKTDSMYYVNELSGVFVPISIKMNITNVRALRSQFLLITVDDRAFENDTNLTDPSDKVTNYLISYPPPGPMRLTRLIESVDSCINPSANKPECTIARIPRNFLGFYYMSSEDETLFEFDSDKEHTTPGRKPTRLIDVYRFQMATRKFEKIVEAWAEKNDSNVSRFTSQTYFIQVLPKVIDNTSTTVQVFLSPRRYKAVSRKALELKIPSVTQPSEMYQYFDHNFKILYLLAGPQIWAIPIEPARLQIQVQPWINPNKADQPILELPKWISKDFDQACTKFTLFNLDFETSQNSKTSSTQVVCLNISLQAGTFFFNPTRTNTLITNTIQDSQGMSKHLIEEKLPIGTIKEVDFQSILQGSFMKLVASNQTSVSEVTNNYLDNYVYKLYFRKSKFLESIYGFETYDGDER